MGRALTFALCLGGLLGCEEDPELELPDKEVCLNRSDGVRYCIDVYEASRRDASATSAGADQASKAKSLETRLPWTEVSWSEAKAACERRGRRLCEADEWVDACDGTAGAGGRTYAYGDTVDATRCNTGGIEVEPGGAFPGCETVIKTLDQSGNVWEWTGNNEAAAEARGGSFRSTQAHRCADTLTSVPLTNKTVEVGFRCCFNP